MGTFEFRPADPSTPSGDALTALSRVLRSARQTEEAIRAALAVPAEQQRLDDFRPEAVAVVIKAACLASLTPVTALEWLALPLAASAALGYLPLPLPAPRGRPRLVKGPGIMYNESREVQQ